MNRSYFLIGVLGILSAFFNPLPIAMLAGFLFSIDYRMQTDVRKYYSLCAITAWTLVKIPMIYYRFYYSYDIRSTALLSYIISLNIYHIGEYLCTAFFHQDKVSWNSNIYIRLFTRSQHSIYSSYFC